MPPFDQWSNFLVAEAGAAAALTGLIFVALSFNFDAIIANPTMLGRAAAGLIMLAQPIFYALIGLMPHSAATASGWVLAVTSALATAALARIVLAGTARMPARPAGTTVELWSRLLLVLGGSLATLAGAILLILTTSVTAALTTIAAGTLTSIALGLGNAWILLVEIRRAG